MSSAWATTRPILRKPSTTSSKAFRSPQSVPRATGSDLMRPQPLRAADRLGLILFHHQADVQSDRLVLPLDRQFRPRRSAYFPRSTFANSASTSTRSAVAILESV